MTAGVIFDCDGVLVDSEPIANRVLAEMLSAEGLPTTTEESMTLFMGGSAATMLAVSEERLGRPLPDDFLARYEAAYEAEFARDLRPVPGIEEALDAIDLPVCVASSGSHAKIAFTLGHTGLLPRFEGRIFSATEVEHGKPAPDLFLHAAARMGFDPSRTVVVEDTPRGVTAGVAAGMRVLAFADISSPAELEAAGGRVFSTMDELPGLVAASTAAG